jgi:hypothetical protein
VEIYSENSETIREKQIQENNETNLDSKTAAS